MQHSTKQRIEHTLKEKLAGKRVEVIDNSAQHAGHPEALKSGGGHFSVLIVSDQFEAKTSIERHRMVYQALAEMSEMIHALAIKTLTSKEASLSP